MGRFESKNNGEVRYYDAMSKKTFSEILSLNKVLALYSFEPEGGYKMRETYFDTPGKLLERAGLTLCKVIEGNKSYFKVERQYADTTLPSINKRQEKYFVHDIEPGDDVKKHMFYLIDGITSMFTTSFNIDLENVLKTVLPTLDIMTRVSKIKVFSGNGFKGYVDCEEITFKNYITKRTVERLMIKVGMTSSISFMPTFQDFTTQLERYCKTMFYVTETRYQIALRVTKQINNGKK